MERPLFVPVSSPTLFRTFYRRADTFLATGPDDGLDAQCSDKMVPDIRKGNTSDHTGPYFHDISIGTQQCNP